MLRSQSGDGREEEGVRGGRGGRGVRPRRDEQRVLVLPDAAGRGAVLRPVVRAALHAALGLPAAALPAPRAPVAAVPQLLLATND